MIALARGDATYPAALSELRHPPDPLWVDGDVTALRAPAIAIVGTRRMTAYGERVAREIAVPDARASRWPRCPQPHSGPPYITVT